MKQLIDKSALVAKLKRLQDALQDPAMNRESMQDYAHGGNKIINEILSFLDTFETKEVDLEKDIKDILNQYYYFPEEAIDTPMIIRITAHHFFELGLKAQKGE